MKTEIRHRFVCLSTCLNHESKGGTLCVAIQSVQADRVCRAWLQTLEKQQQQQQRVKPEQNTKITHLKLMCICELLRGNARHTCEGVGGCISWDRLADGGVRATTGRGLNEVTSDGFQLRAPGQCERSVLHIRDTNTPWRTHICIRG